MRRIALELLIHTLIVALLFPILPGISIIEATIWTYLGIGLVLSLLRLILKPIMLLLTGQLVIWNLALWVLLINVGVFVATWWVVRSEWIIGGLFWVVLSALLVGLVTTVTSALLGFERPDLDPNNRRQALWRLIERLPSGQRSRIIDNLRLQQIYDTAMQYGMEILLGNSSLAAFRARAARFITGRDNELDKLTAPHKVRLMLEQLGPMYVKLGQIVSSQSALIPEEWRIELAKLQSTVTPFTYQEARAIIELELGRSLEELFVNFAQTPLAAASTAQVHRATLPEGTQVIVKVQRPNIVAQVRTDLRIMLEAARMLERRFSWARDLDLSGMVAVFAEGVNKELDYTNEAYHMIRVGDSMASIPGVHVPTIYRQLSTSRVLTMEFIDGVKISKIAAVDPAIDRLELARTFMRAMMKQIIVDGFFHADPHPGNLFISPTTGEITFLDFGLVGELRADQRIELFDLLISLQQFDTQGVGRALRQLSVATRPINDGAYYFMVESALIQSWKYSEGGSFGAAINKLLGMLARNGLQMNRQLTLAVKAIAQTEEATAVMIPGVPLFPIVVGEVQSLMVEQFTPEQIVDTLQTQAIRAGKELLRRLPSLPEATIKWLDQYQAGRLKLEIDTGDLSSKLDRLSSSTTDGLQRLAIGMILAGMLIGSAIGLGFMSIFEGVIWQYIYALVLVAFLAVLIYSAIVVWMLIRSMRPPRDRHLL
jgi:ubiquinone biosynthesis protein